MHFDLPFRLDRTGHFATVQQGTEADIVARITGILRSRVGYRDDAPDFGITDPAWRQGGADLEEIAAALEAFAPDAARVVTRDPALLASIIDRVRIAPEEAS